MRSVADTPFGRFDIIWGSDSDAPVDERYGSMARLARTGDRVTIVDPLHGELKTFDLYRHRTEAGCLVIVTEISNGIWAHGFLLNGQET